MKVLDKIGLELFSGLMLILTVLIGLTIFGWLDINLLTNLINSVIKNNQTITNVVLGIDVVLMLLAVKCLFFNGFDKSEPRSSGVLLENEQGKLLITKETLENLASSVVKGFDNIESTNTKVDIDSNNDVTVNVNISVNQYAVIKDLTANLQNSIKDVIKKTSDLDVKEVNVVVKNVTAKKEA